MDFTVKIYIISNLRCLWFYENYDVCVDVFNGSCLKDKAVEDNT